MSTQARLADVLLQKAGHGGLWEWAMDQRRSANPAPWDDVAVALAGATNGEVQVQGRILRRWVIAAEEQRESGTSGSEG
jgi:hypothetical protein